MTVFWWSWKACWLVFVLFLRVEDLDEMGGIVDGVKGGVFERGRAVN